VIDRIADKKIIHKNKAARHKSLVSFGKWSPASKQKTVT
jgi:ribosomal protein S20